MQGRPPKGGHPKTPARIVSTGSLDAHVHSMKGPQTASESPVFVLLHGIGMSHRYYRRLQAPLSTHGEMASLNSS